MDSSNSGSFQSSSGGAGDNNDEYDSTTTTTTTTQSQSISSSFFNSPPSTNLLFNPPNHHHLLQLPTYPQPHRPSDHTTTTFFSPSSAPPFSSNPLQDPGSAWTGTMRPDHINLPDFGSYSTINPNPSTTDTQTKTPRGSDHHQIGVAVKNSKKRTRASRRAPTTVLTTDTTNFRQMVQEFTGIPTAPFTAAAPFSRRLDLFRPSPSQPPPFLNSAANILDSAHTTSNININSSNNTSAATTSSNYHFAPSTMNNFQKQPSSFLDSQNPMFSFQSLLQNSVPQQPKRWGHDQDGKLEELLVANNNNNNTTQNNIIGGSNSKLENMLVVTSRSSGGGGDQVQGNEASWNICPST